MRKTADKWKTFKTDACPSQSGCLSQFSPGSEHATKKLKSFISDPAGITEHIQLKGEEERTARWKPLRSKKNMDVHLNKPLNFWNNVLWTVGTKVDLFGPVQHYVQKKQKNSAETLHNVCQVWQWMIDDLDTFQLLSGPWTMIKTESLNKRNIWSMLANLQNNTGKE